MIKFGSLFVGALLIPSLLPSGQACAGTIRLLHIDLSYPASAVSYNLYKNGQLVCANTAPSTLGIECSVELDPVPMTFTVTAVDPNGSESPPSAPYILYPPPLLTANFTATPPSVPSSTTFSFDAGDSLDPDGMILQYAWDFGDGSAGTGKFIDHTYALPGPYTVRLTVIDDDHNSAVTEDTIIVDTPTKPPKAIGKKISAREDSATNGILAAISDTDAPLTYSLASPPLHGTITRLDAPTGAFSYKPHRNFSGTDRFTFTAVSSGMRSLPASVDITVTEINDAPKAVTDSGGVRSKGTIAIPVLANDTDPERDPLRVVSITRPNIGKAKLVNSQVVYTAPAKAGVVTFSYQISDGKGGAAIGTIKVSITK